MGGEDAIQWEEKRVVAPIRCGKDFQSMHL